MSNNGDIKSISNFNVQNLYSSSMLRLIAKIAYEWFCYRNSIKEYQPRFEKIVDYTVSNKETGEFPIKYIVNGNITKNIASISRELVGNHFLFATGEFNRISIVVSLFGICTYLVNLDKLESNVFENICIYEVLKVDGTKIFCDDLRKRDELIKDYCSNNPQNYDNFNHTLTLDNSVQSYEIAHKLKLCELTHIFKDNQNEIKLISCSETIKDSFHENYKFLLNYQIVTIKMLKDFVGRITNNFNLKLCFNDSENAVLIYYVWLIGKSDLIDIEKEAFSSIAKEFECNNEWVNLIKDLILKDKNSDKYITEGKTKIENSH
jgi:hypothetical protein